MADAAVTFLLEKLYQLLRYNADLISNVKGDVESLYSELEYLTAFLKDSTETRNSNELMKMMVKKTREVVYEAEDAVELFVSVTSEQRARNNLLRAINILDYGANLRKVALDVKSIMKDVRDMYEKERAVFPALQHGEGSERSTIERKAPVVEEENVVGFQDEAEEIIKLLTTGSEDLEVISIIGMAGLGKTTLAKKVYCDSTIEYEFYSRAWVYVSQECNIKEVFLNILCKLSDSDVNDNMYKMSVENLANKLRGILEKEKYLIVMDDVWNDDVWRDLKMAFPNNKNRSRILLTSRILSVGQHANPNRDPHCLRFLTEEESWTLLQKKALGSKQCPEELIEHGQIIAKQCLGLPLAIVVIGGILLERGTEIHWWEKVKGRVNAYLALDRERRMDKFIALSFNNLPHHLRACFLYFGMFPEDFQIPMSKLVRLWIAEGLIEKEEHNLNLEDIAEEYLEDLVNRNLVMVGKRRSDGKVKICHVHDMIHDFCKEEAAKQNFFHETKHFNQCSNSSAPILPVKKYRRLGIHSHVLDILPSEQFGFYVRSLLCFSPEDITLPLNLISSILKHFMLLRVLDGKPITFKKFPTDLTLLIHLRYLVLSITIAILPETISKLKNLQTLIVVTSTHTLEIKADIWKMIQLRHLEVNASTSLLKTGKSKGDLSKLLAGPFTSKKRNSEEDSLKSGNLVILSTISPESCSEDVFAAAPNLKKLGIRGQLSKLLEGKGGTILFDSLGKKLVNLENLKLLNDVYPRPSCESKLVSLPQAYKFPPKLKKLTLSDTLLDWEHMSTLGKLENLEILKLKENAFAGKLWQPEEGGFRALRVLHIGKTDLVSWSASAVHFPRLRRLYLKHCTELYEVPSGLGDISSLQIMDLHCTNKSAAASARKIELLKKNFEDQQSTKGSGFKLNIYPPEPPAEDQ
ncbi:late blight resistance homolog R1B-17 [Olea europaea subsp. europaea]|uniref:Late blight resistance homolog R1B-17 n=1 Tax=Olea europaea subsp. europaea TaxID=158383 RepID=A0A8S0UX95_OLEEU|nr:late blight resistance homolog R1B-17 [Olea europaea subsp. europaea]